MKTKDIVIMGALIAISAVLSMIKISALGSVALDALPAFLALYLFRDNKGVVVAFFGHIFSSAIAGFPLSLPVHILLAVIMGLIVFIGKIVLNNLDKHMNTFVAEVIVAIIMFILNAFVSPLAAFISLPFSVPAYIGLVTMLWLASLINVGGALVLSIPLKPVVKNNG
ncbi:MAG: ECF transporter S component [Erysipelotrichales bacterium]